MMASRLPCPALRPFVRLLWAGPPRPGTASIREHVLPTGCMHIALRFAGPPLRLFDGQDDERGRTVGHAVVGGVRPGFYLRESAPAWSVGAQLEPGAAPVLFGVGTDALALRHTLLHDLWGPASALLLEQLEQAGEPWRCIALLEAALLRRLQPRHAMHPGVAAALAAVHGGASVEAAVRASGFSHRHLLARFRAATGMAPRQYGRVLRLQEALRALETPGPGLASVAAAAGYADQAHFGREFRVFTGLTPGEWRAARPTHAHHVPVPR